jgi:putative membrane protein
MLDMQMGRKGVALIATMGLVLTAACGGGDADGDSAMGDTMNATGIGAAPGDTMGAAGAGGAMGDPMIVGQMSGANAAEIAAGQAAQEKAQNADVRQFAQMMVTEHQAMQAQVDSVVTQTNMQRAPVPDSLGRHLEEGRQRLTGQAAGAEFDRMYMDMQVTDHQNTLNALNAARGAAQSAELRTVIEAAIPKVQQHLDRAQQIRQGLGGA